MGLCDGISTHIRLWVGMIFLISGPDLTSTPHRHCGPFSLACQPNADDELVEDSKTLMYEETG